MPDQRHVRSAAVGVAGATEQAVAPRKPNRSNQDRIAELKLHCDVETQNRGRPDLAQLDAGGVGHSWVSVSLSDPTRVPSSMTGKSAVALASAGRTSFGFWPKNGVALKQNGKPDIMKDTPGVVKEPDTGHAGREEATQTYAIDEAQLLALVQYKDSHQNSSYNLSKYNCTTFAVEAVEAAGHEAPEATYVETSIKSPNGLYEDLYKADQAGTPNIDVAPLLPGETHQ